MAEGNPGSSLRTDVFQRRSNFDPLTTVEQNDHVGAAAYLMKRAVAAVAVGALPDGIPVIVSGSRDGTVRVWGLAGGTPVAPQLDLPESVSGVVVTTTSSSPRPGPISRSTIECARYPRASWRSISGNVLFPGITTGRRSHRIMAGYVRPAGQEVKP
jgi:WD40 repeat protein